jgi:hypothetical protein
MCCGEQPDFVTRQGVAVYDPRGRTNAEDVARIVDCFFEAIPEAVGRPVDGFTFYYHNDISNECPPKSLGCSHLSAQVAIMQWLGGHHIDATAHEMLHIVDAHGPCGRDQDHVCNPDGNGVSTWWNRLGYKGPNLAHACYGREMLAGGGNSLF